MFDNRLCHRQRARLRNLSYRVPIHSFDDDDLREPKVPSQGASNPWPVTTTTPTSKEEEEEEGKPQ